MVKQVITSQYNSIKKLLISVQEKLKEAPKKDFNTI